MWGRKKPDAPRTAKPEPKDLQANQPSGPASTTVEGTQIRKEARLGPSLQMKGEITGSEDLVIDGSFEGIVQLGEGKLTVGATANVTADIIAPEVVVCGKVKGNVRAKGKIEIKKDGSVNGDLTTAQIIIEDGAYFKGSIEIHRSTDKEANNNISPGTACRPTTSSAAAAGAEPRSI